MLANCGRSQMAAQKDEKVMQGLTVGAEHSAMLRPRPVPKSDTAKKLRQVTSPWKSTAEAKFKYNPSFSVKKKPKKGELKNQWSQASCHS